MLDPLDHQLSDPLAPHDPELLGWIGVDQEHLQLAAVARVDQPGRVETGHPMGQCQAAARLDEPGVSGWYRDGQARRDEGSASAWLEHRTFAGPQVETSVAGTGVSGKWELGVETADRDLDHECRLALIPPPALGSSPLATISSVLVWMDLEMTGLDPRRDVIVEIATLVTDDDLEVVALGPDLVIHQPDEELARMGEVVRDMHTSSGLIEQIRTSELSLGSAGQRTLDFIKLHVPEPRTAPLCGNSIGTDRRFLDAYLPEVENYLHYRSIDVSTIKELARRWYPEVYDNAPTKASTHRALEDIKESIAELGYYRRTIFRDVTRPSSQVTSAS